jgi:hypothetical protein
MILIGCDEVRQNLFTDNVSLFLCVCVFEETPHSLLINLVIRITNALRRSKQPVLLHLYRQGNLWAVAMDEALVAASASCGCRHGPMAVWALACGLWKEPTFLWFKGIRPPPVDDDEDD